MKKRRRLLTALLIINFIIGMASGMKPLNLTVVILNGILVIVAAVLEIKRHR